MGILHVFDMDGTLLTGSTASLQVAGVHGTVDDLVALEARFASGEMGTHEFAVAVHALWRDLTPTLVEAAFAGSPWLNGIEDVCADIRRRGEHSVVITMSPDFFAARLLDLGFDEVHASRFPAPPFREPIDPAGILTPPDKVEVTEQIRARYGLPLSRRIAYGDSMSDAPLFGHLTATVAVNGDEHLRELAAVSYQGDDLTEAYAVARALVPAE